MKKNICIMLCFMMFSNIINAQDTPKWADKAKKAVFSIVTYDKDNKIKSTGNGFFVNANGTAISDYTLFSKAQKAVAITEGGKELQITAIVGANSMYDVIKFVSEADKKSGALKIASLPSKKGDKVYLLPYSTKKVDTLQTGKIISVDSIGKNNYYYTVDIKTNPKLVSCPLMNEAGEVIGSIQKNAFYSDNESYAIGIGFSNALSINALSGNDEALNSVGIKKALPNDENQAQIYLMLISSQLDHNTYFSYLNDFIAKFPSNSSGYQKRAEFYLYNKKYDSNGKLALEDIKKALNSGKDKAANKADVSKIIYRYNLEKKDSIGNDWNLDKALEYIQQAIKEDNQPAYIQQEADIFFTMKRYQDAYNSYEKVNKTSLASSSSLFSAAKSLQLIKDYDKNKVLCLMDSAIAKFTKPYTEEVAPYIYERALAKTDMEKYREAVEDYNAFYDIVNGDVTANFYFQRQESEMKCKMYKQAIDDINEAVELTPKDPIMWVEKGAIHIRVGQIDKAILALKRAIDVDPKFGEAYRMLGYCQIRQKKENDAKVNLLKAKELGDTVADSLLKKYFK